MPYPPTTASYSVNRRSYVPSAGAPPSSRTPWYEIASGCAPAPTAAAATTSPATHTHKTRPMRMPKPSTPGASAGGPQSNPNPPSARQPNRPAVL